MAAIVVWRIEEGGLVSALQEAEAKLDTVTGELVLDFSAVHRIDASALRAMQELARAAEERAIALRLRGVKVDIYKVLKLAGLAAAFSFVD